MEQKQFKCTGNCLNCAPSQRGYCASQHAYSNMKVLDKMMDEVLTLQADVKALSEKIEAIQDNEAHVFNPAIASDTPCTSAASSQQPSPATTPTASAAGPDTSQKGGGE